MATCATCFAHRRKRASRSFSSCLILMTASGVLFTAPVFLGVSPSYAAPAPFPPLGVQPVPQWLRNFINDMKDGGLTSADVAALIDATNKGGYFTLKSLVDRLNQLAANMGVSFRFKIVMYPVDAAPGDDVTLTVIVFDQKSGKTIETHEVGDAIFNPFPPKGNQKTLGP